MFGSEALDVGIGVSLFFLVTSLICSAIREMIETIMRSRARDLERGLRELLDDPTGQTLTRSVFAHGQISSLFAGDYEPEKLNRSAFGAVVQMPWSVRGSLPSYIPAAQFATALMDIVARGPGDWPYPVDPRPMTVETLRAQAGLLPSGRLQRTILSAIDHGANDLATIRTNIETWFNGSMDRVSGWYKRRTQKWLFAIGLIAAVTMNLDALTVTTRLIEDKTLRAAFVAEAERTQAQGLPGGTSDAAAGSAPAAPAPAIGAMREQLRAIGTPMGWANGYPDPQSCVHRAANGSCPGGERLAWQRDHGLTSLGRWVSVVFGWLITASAVTIGAPFWFDMLNRMMVIRSTVKPHEKSVEEPSEDRQEPAVAAVAPIAGPAPVADPEPETPVASPIPPGYATGAVPGFDPEQWRAPYVNTAEIVL